MTPDADQPKPPASSPQPAASTPPPAASTPAPVATGTGLQPTVAAALACVIPLAGGIVFLVLEKKDKYVRFYAMQAVFFWVAGLAVSIVLRIATMILGVIPFLGTFVALIVSAVVGLSFLAVWIILIVKALSNTEWEIPYLGPPARKQLESGKLGAA